MPSVKDLFKLAVEEKPSAFKEVFDEIMLAKIVDISDEMKDELAHSMFGESSHYRKKKNNKNEPHEGKKEVEESFEPEEDEDEYEDVGDEDEDFDISDEDLEDLDLDDFDFEDEDEEEISESNIKRILGDRSTGGLSPEELAELEAEIEARKAAAVAAHKKTVDKFVTGAKKARTQIEYLNNRLKIK